jgi:hypothetical protein
MSFGVLRRVVMKEPDQGKAGNWDAAMALAARTHYVLFRFGMDVTKDTGS